MRRLSSVDAQFLAMEDGRTHAHVCQLTMLDAEAADGTRLDAERVRQVVADRIHLLPPFRWRLKEVPLGLDYPVFVDDPEFDLDTHIDELAVPPPGDDRRLGELVATLASRPLDRARPLWQTYVIHGVSDDRIAILTKVHHALVDGVSGIEMLSTLLDDAPDSPGPRAHEDQGTTSPRSAGIPSDAELALRGLASLPAQPLRMLRAMPATLRHIDSLPTMRHMPGARVVHEVGQRAQRALSGRDGGVLEPAPAAKAPRSSISGAISAHRRFAFGTLPLPAIKAVKDHRPPTTINDVVVALMAGGLRRRLAARGDRLAEPLVALVPISVRSPDQDDEYGNYLSSLIVRIPTDEADPLRRLDRAHEVMASAKERHAATPATLLRDANHTVPPALFARTARMISGTTASGLVDPPFNVTISNIPGSRTPLYFAGALVRSQHPVNVLLDGVGLSITLLSYRDRMDVGLTADRELVPDVWDLMADIEDELAALTEAVVGAA